MTGLVMKSSKQAGIDPVSRIDPLCVFQAALVAQYGHIFGNSQRLFKFKEVVNEWKQEV